MIPNRDKGRLTAISYRLITLIGVIVPRRLRERWLKEWKAELEYRERSLVRWNRLDWQNRLELLRRSLGAFSDALLLQPRRLEEEMFQDLRYGLRMLRQRPGFTLAAVMALALGIGANTAIFSVVNAVLLRPLPFADPDRLLMVWQTSRQGDYPQLSFPYPNFEYLREQSQVCESIGAWNSYSNTRFALTGGSQPEQVQYAIVTADLFSVLGIKPLLGRAFLPEEDRPGAARVAIISHGLWQRRWAANPSLIGQSVPLDGKNYTVVGIMPPGFDFPRFPRVSEVWVPLSGDPFPGRRFSPATRYLNVVARLKAGTAFAQAAVEMEAIARRIEQQEPQFNRGLGIAPTPLQRQLTGHLRLALFVLLGAVAFVLLIACSNVANLLLARASTRQKEIAIRLALGATRLRLVRQLLTESIMLALLGGVLGLAIAQWSISLFSLIPYNATSYFIPYNTTGDQIAIDWSVLAFTFGLTLLAGIIFGLAPAVQSSRADIYAARTGAGLSSGVGLIRQRIRGLLVATQIALSLILLVGAGLMIKSFIRLQRVDPGFVPERVLTADLSLPRAKYTEREKVAAFHAQVLEQLRALPGVESAGLISSLPLSGTNADTSFFIEGWPVPEPRERPHTHPRTISPDYFRAMGVKMIEGRSFSEQDHGQSPRVAIINETMARRFWPSQPAIGKRIALDYESMKYFRDRPPELDLAAGMREIVGIAGDVKHEGLETGPQPEMYIPDRQLPEHETNLVLRTSANPSNLAASLRSAVHAVDPDQPVANIRLMSQLLADSLAKPRFNYLLFSIFAGIALILAATGVYGVMAYAVELRTREMGIRLALGAQPIGVLTLVVRQGMKSVFGGVVFGLAGAIALMRIMASMLFEVRTTDPAIFIGVAGLLVAVALLACYLPARRATKVDPVIALRDE
jgi:putative ABC transport system permease protein